MNQPAYLKKGDKVAIVAPAKRVTREEIAPAIDVLSGWGLQVVEGNNLYVSDNYFAGNDNQRLADLQEMLNHPDVRAIICARGGYGTTRLLDKIDWHEFRHHPKWLVGFSDITALLTHMLTNVHTTTIHGPMAFNFGNPKAANALEHLRKLLFAEPITISLPPHELNNPAQATGLIIGGNLSMLTNIIGTSSDINYNQRILLLEEIEEYYYRIDRMMTHLLRAGKLEHLSAIVVGQFSQMMENQIPFGKDAYQIISEIVSPFELPVFFNAPFGHVAENLAFPHGVPGSIVNDSGQWRLCW